MKTKIVINKEYPQVRAFAQEIARQGVPEDAEVIYQGRRNQIFKLSMADGRQVTIKRFKIPNWVNAIAYRTLRKSKARRSYEHGMQLLSHGFLTPTPLAYIELSKGLMLRHSYYICDFIDAPTVRFWEERPDCEPLLAAMASDLVKMHRQGVWHKDYSPGNILAQGNPKVGYKLYYVDINRMKFDMHDHKKQMRNFRSISLVEDETRHLARHYAQAAGIDPEQMQQIASQQLRTYLHKKELHNRITKFLHIGKYKKAKPKTEN